MDTLVPVKRIILLIDLAGFAKASQTADDSEIVEFLQDYYAACAEVLSPKGGTVVKFMGDACLATFLPEAAKQAVEGLVEMQGRIKTIAAKHQLAVTLGANLHMTSAIETELGTGSNKRHDIIGRGVNQTFLLGRGTGIRISEPVYRALPSFMRSAWTKHKPPAIYHLESPDGLYEGHRKDAASNTLRW